MGAWQQSNTYDCGVWAVANAWAWLEWSARPTEVGVTNRLRIGRGILNAVQVAEQTEQAQSQPTGEVVYIYAHENFGLAPGREQPPIRMTTPQRELLISAAGQAQQMSSPQRPANPATPRAPPSTASLSSARSSQLATPPSMRRERPDRTGRVVSERGSPMPRGQVT
jgi:hypothetical protein